MVGGGNDHVEPSTYDELCSGKKGKRMQPLQISNHGENIGIFTMPQKLESKHTWPATKFSQVSKCATTPHQALLQYTTGNKGTTHFRTTF